MIIYEELYKKHGLSASQQKIIELVGEKKSVLEIGASSGYMTKFFLANKCLVDAVELDKESVEKLRKLGVKSILGSIEDEDIFKKLSKNYDFIILADVLEHLINPEKALVNLKKISNQKTQLIISMPNIASWPMRKQLFFYGDFEYQDSGILDKTHLHFYSTATIEKLLKETGWRVSKLFGTQTILPLQRSLIRLPFLGILFKIIYFAVASRFKNLAYFHFVLSAEKYEK